VSRNLVIPGYDLIQYLKIHASGYANRKSGQEIADRFRIIGDNGSRRVRETAHALKRDHYPVCSVEDGYYWPLDHEDAKPAIHHLKKLFQPLREAYEGFLSGLDDELGAEPLFDERLRRGETR